MLSTELRLSDIMDKRFNSTSHSVKDTKPTNFNTLIGANINPNANNTGNTNNQFAGNLPHTTNTTTTTQLNHPIANLSNNSNINGPAASGGGGDVPNITKLSTIN
jgi:hypothetical protein